MRYLTVGIFAHIDSGKTTLTERILFEAGKITAAGSIEDGTTESDTLKEEIERGISIRTTFHSLPWKTGFGEFILQIVDTPGHIDFRNQITDILPAIQTAIVVLEGGSEVQSQARLVIEELLAANIPILFFINKLDKFGDDYLDSLVSLEEILGTAPVVLFDRKDETFVHYFDSSHLFPKSTGEDLIKWSDELLLSAWNDPDGKTRYDFIGLKTGPKAQKLFPVYGGSAKQGVGVRELLDLLCWVDPKDTDTSSNPNFVLSRRTNAQNRNYIVLFPKEDLSFPFQNTDPSQPYRIESAYSGEEEGKITSVQKGQLYMVWADENLSAIPGEDLHAEKSVSLSRDLSRSPFSIRLEPELSSEKDFWLCRLKELIWEDPGYHFSLEEDTGQIRFFGRGELHLEVGTKRLLENTEKKLQIGSINIARFERLKKMSSKVALEHRAFEETKSSGTLTAVLEDTADFSKQIAFEVSLPEEVKNSIETAFYESISYGFFGFEVIGVRLTVLSFQLPPPDKEFLPSLLKVAVHSGLKDLFHENTKLVGPLTEVEISVDANHLGVVLSELNRRSAKIHSVEEERAGKSHLKATASAENMLGFSGALRNMTKGIGISWERTAFTSEFYAVLKE
ncbi:elongation factor G-like protein [Leptospira idonii]|uniref:Elongation factor G-like protein n=1 Tax=Leptospira idonii TaxID=1193500 RepID=A0A4R9LVV6_9LEPT|nr:elongation factor G-like protein [Leptospira idonii]TGN18340.1 elongation factor G-like protein [Leptospira idonii]